MVEKIGGVNGLNQVFVLSVVFLLAMFFFTFYLVGFTKNIDYGNGRDYKFHYANARNESANYPYTESALNEYPPFFKIVSSPFSFNESTFYVFTLLVTCFLFPILLYFVFRDTWIVIAYFLVSNLVYVIDIVGAYPQVIVSMFLLLMIKIKFPVFRVILIFCSLFVHRWAWIAFLVFWLCEIIVFEVKVWRGNRV